MITLVHQLERENWSTRVIHGYYLYIIAREYTTVSNSSLCIRGHNAIGGYCTLQNVLEVKSRPSIVIQDNSPLGTKGMSLKGTIRKEQIKWAIAKSYTHIRQAQIDKGEVKNRASEEHNRRGDDHTGTP